ncbi:hypothetical protein TIFTF001_038696 [Ficus carica]|uniref:Uncharacterized protein n=1 Tax=Ficus carica TaxID=3494 RepID=A0AA88JDB1_FICCA|nr:hypothetical protein TIFTF001_038696 [Ficus carica]
MKTKEAAQSTNPEGSHRQWILPGSEQNLDVLGHRFLQLPFVSCHLRLQTRQNLARGILELQRRKIDTQ